MIETKEYEREQAAKLLDGISRDPAKGSKEQISKASDLEPGLYVGAIKSVSAQYSAEYGQQIKVVTNIVGKILLDKSIEWEDYGFYSTVYPAKFPDKIQGLLETFAACGCSVKGKPLKTGGDLLRCEPPAGYVNVRVLRSSKTGKSFIAYINPPFGDYQKPEGVSKRASSDKKTSFLNDVPAFS